MMCGMACGIAVVAVLVRRSINPGLTVMVFWDAAVDDSDGEVC